MEQLIEFLSPDNIIYEVKSSGKTEVIEEMLAKAVDSRQIREEDFEEILAALLKREKSMSTGIGSGVAIPHCSVSFVDEVKCVMGLSRGGIDFEAIDHMPVNIFILLIVPKSKFQEHIRTLAVIAKTLNSSDDRSKLMNCNNFEDVQEVFRTVES